MRDSAVNGNSQCDEKIDRDNLAIEESDQICYKIDKGATDRRLAQNYTSVTKSNRRVFQTGAVISL